MSKDIEARKGICGVSDKTGFVKVAGIYERVMSNENGQAGIQGPDLYEGS